MQIFKQDKTTQSLISSLISNRVHQAFFFYGPASVGKLTTALALVYNYFCTGELAKNDFKNQQKQSPTFLNNFGSCLHCQNCLQLRRFQHPSLTAITTGDLLPKVTFLANILTNQSSRLSSPEQVLSELISSIRHLIQRHKVGFLNPIQRKKDLKKSFPHGKVLEEKRYDEFFHKLHFNLDQLANNKNLDWLKSKEFLTTIDLLQNSLDRSFLPKDKLIKLFTWSRSQAGFPKWIIIDNINLINNEVVGVFLKNLEDPDPDTRFILISDELSSLNQGIITPLLSRCVKYRFNSLEGSVGTVLKEVYGYTPENADYFHFPNMESYFNFSNQTDRQGGEILRIFNQPIYQQLSDLQKEKGKFTLHEVLYQLRHKLENYLPPETLPFSYSAGVKLTKILREVEMDMERKTFNEYPLSYVKLASFIKNNTKLKF